MEGTDVKANVRDEMKRSMESLCKVIDTYQNEERVILHHLQDLVENAIEDKTIDVEAAPVDFFEGSVCKEAEFSPRMKRVYRSRITLATVMELSGSETACGTHSTRNPICRSPFFSTTQWATI